MTKKGKMMKFNEINEIDKELEALSYGKDWELIKLIEEENDRSI